MEWLNIHLPVLRSPEYISAEPISRATWLSVLGYCCQQENRGTIPGAALWKDRQWQQSCGVTHDEVLGSAPLILFVADDAVVWKYPNEKEAEVQNLRALGKIKSAAKAEAARLNGCKGGRPRNPDNPTGTERKTEREETQITQRKPIEGEGKGNRKEKGKNTADAELVFPVELDAPDFHQAWQDYVDYRARRKLSALLSESVSRQFAKMAGWGLRSSIYQINETIANGWQGIFDPKPGSKFATENTPVRKPNYITPIEQALRDAEAAQ